MAKKRARFAINVDSGVVVFRSESTDALQTIWKLIDDATATAIVKKKVSATAVIEAIQKAIVRDEGFSWKEYDAKRRKDRELFNVSEHDMVPDREKDPNGEKDTEKEDAEVLSLKDLGLGGSSAGKQNQKPKTKPPADNTDEKSDEKPSDEEKPDDGDDGVQY